MRSTPLLATILLKATPAGLPPAESLLATQLTALAHRILLYRGLFQHANDQPGQMAQAAMQAPPHVQNPFSDPLLQPKPTAT